MATNSPPWRSAATPIPRACPAPCSAISTDAKELARKDAEDISKFLGEVFQSPEPTRDGREIKVVELLDRAARKLEADLATQPAQRAKLQTTLGQTYLSLGLARQAVPLHEKVRDYHLTASGAEHPDTLRAMNRLAIACLEAGHLNEAIKMLEDTVQLGRKVFGPEHPITLETMTTLAESCREKGEVAHAEALEKETVAAKAKAPPPAQK